MNSSEETRKRVHQETRKPSKKRWAVVILVPVVVVLGVLLYLAYQELLMEPRIIAPEIPQSITPANYELSQNQTEIMTLMGPPESFVILFFDEDTDDGTRSFRVETWSYFTKGAEYTFADGDLLWSGQIDVEEAELIPTLYSPEQFIGYMGLEELIVATQMDKFLVVPLEKELVEGGEVYYAEELTFGMKNGELLYVETLPLVVEG